MARPIEHDRVVDLDYRHVESIARAVQDYPNHIPIRITKSPTLLISHREGVAVAGPWLDGILKTKDDTITIVRKMTSLIFLSVVCLEIPDDHEWKDRILAAGRAMVSTLSHDETRPKKPPSNLLTDEEKREIEKAAQDDD